MEHDLDADERVVDVDGTAVRCFVAGPTDAPSVVLVHGGGMDAASVSWKETVPALADDYRVYAPDLPGYGGSEGVPAEVTPDVSYYVDVVGELLDDLDVVEATLVGFSKGGGVALGYTLESPARVSELVLVDSYGLADEVPGGVAGAAYVNVPGLLEATWWAMRKSRRVTRAAVANLVHPEHLDEALVDEAHREVRRPGSGEAYHRFRRAEVGWRGLRTDYSDLIAELPVPTLFVHGSDDPLIPQSQAKRAADAAPVADLFTLADCGHWPPREHPEAFVSRLRAWLDG